MEHEKGPDLVIRALKELGDAYLWLAGTGSYESTLRELATELGLSARIRFLGWHNDSIRFCAPPMFLSAPSGSRC